jgi:hypothetical protein
MSTTKYTNKLLGVTEADDSLLNDVLYGRTFMDDREKKQAAWKAFVGMDLDAILKQATGLDNLEKFKRTWKDSDHWDEPGTDERAQYEEAMYPALDIYYPIEARNTDVYLRLRGKVQRAVNYKLYDLGFDEKKLGWNPETGKDVMGQIRGHIEGYVKGWVSYRRLDDYDAMEVLYR